MPTTMKTCDGCKQSSTDPHWRVTATWPYDQRDQFILCRFCSLAIRSYGSLQWKLTKNLKQKFPIWKHSKPFHFAVDPLPEGESP